MQAMLMAVFDKSFLQSLSVDEAVVFDVLFMSNITPLFFVETLADLKKQMSDGRTAEQVVGNLARKTPQLHSYPNTFHLTLCGSELLGENVEMAGRPAVAHGKPFRVGKKNGVSFGIAPEMQALQRWQSHQFLDVEHDFAAQWRAMLKELPAGALKLVQQDGEKLRLADLAAAKAMAADLIDKAPQLADHPADGQARPSGGGPDQIGPVATAPFNQSVFLQNEKRPPHRDTRHAEVSRQGSFGRQP